MNPEFWQDKRPNGIPHTINPRQYSSITEIFSEAFSCYRSLPAFSCMGVTLTFEEIDHLSTDFAAYLQQKTNLKPGDRVAIQLPNTLQYAVGLYGILKAGLVIVNTNPLYTPRESREQFNDAGAKALLCLDMFAPGVASILAETNIETVIVTGFMDAPALKNLDKAVVTPPSIPGLSNALSFIEVLKQGKNSTYIPVKVQFDDIAMLQYTGGTTGIPKGAMLTQASIVAITVQMQAFSKQLNEKAVSLIAAGDIVICPLPMYHIYSFIVNCMSNASLGVHHVLIPNPRDINGFIQELKKWKFSSITGINTLFVALMSHPEFSQLDFSQFKSSAAGGTALLQPVAEQWHEKTGVIITEGYGLTETSGVACANPYGKAARFGTVGLPLPSTSIRIMDDDENDLGLNTAGEICVYGPQLMKGYWQKSEETAKVFTKDGGLKTGDVGILEEDGFIRIVDRKKDMILVSGFNVYPNEIEAVVSTHPKVGPCAAIGIPDEKTGEAVKLFVIPKDPSLTEEELMAYCKQNLTGYKLPKTIEFRKELPMTPIGKILRRELRKEVS